MALPTSPLPVPQPLRVGIVGAGPGGLALAIFLSRQEDISIRIYQQAKELREIGAGIHLQRNTYGVSVSLRKD